MAKLVEILARELKEWPDCKYGEKIETKALTQDDDGRINALDSGCSAEQDQFNGGVWSGAQWTWTDLNFERAEDYTTAIVTRAEWQAAVDALNKPDAVEWDGVGLPPVGTRCEMSIGDSGNEWVEGVVVCHINWDRPVAVAHNEEDVFNGYAEDFRPIRTPEQIAAEERKEAIDKMVQFFMNYYGNPKGAEQYLLICRSLHDAGYRKQEQK